MEKKVENQFNNLVEMGVLGVKKEKRRVNKRRVNNPLKETMENLKFFNKNGIINTLSVLPSGMNSPSNYTYISFKIPKNEEKKNGC